MPSGKLQITLNLFYPVINRVMLLADSVDPALEHRPILRCKNK
jgi:hypothetical protein